uniref:Cytochrome P450, family 2, subfamily P, polypeptide 6 n=1 Tax=Myripristis murdjan TaxID=586833 RepID=A0A667XMB4_9TELE
MDLVSSVFGSIAHWVDIQSLLLFTVLFLLIADYLKTRRPSSFPPGPWALPFVGNIFTVDFNRAHKTLTQHGYHSILQRHAIPSGLRLVGRSFIFQQDNDPKHTSRLCKGLIFSNGHLWKQQRRFSLSTLKYFGVGRKSLELAILDEFTYSGKSIADLKGKPFNPHLIINNAVSNMICSLIVGHRFEYEDERFIKLIKRFDSALQSATSIWAQLYNAFPFSFGVKDMIRSEIKQHKKDWNPAEPRDYIDCYLMEIQMRKGDAESTFSEENLVICALDLFVAGSETTSTTLRWAFLYMAKYPEIQEKVQAEIDRVIGQSRKPSMMDRANLPYTDAVIHEIQRMGNIVPLSLRHSTNRDIQLGDYTVPKGVVIIPNLTSVLFDKREWETPYTFNPGHFLNEEGKFVKRAAFIPFSAGKRVCLGENLARMEIFLFFTSFMQRFTISVPAGTKLVLDFCFGFTLARAPYEICATLCRE